MKAIAALILCAMLFGACGGISQGLKPEIQKMDCPPCECPPCPTMKCMPSPTEPERVPCYYRHDVLDSLGLWIPSWVPTLCHPDCVDGDGVMIPGCNR